MLAKLVVMDREKREVTQEFSLCLLIAKSALTLDNISKGGQSSTSNIIDFIMIYIL